MNHPIKTVAVKMELAKKTALTEIDNSTGALNDLSQSIWSNPELAFKEFHAHKVLTDFFEQQGFQVERSHKLETAFRAVYDADSNSGPNIAVLCEYDALPGIGHACGHNLIAEVGVAAAIGVKAAMKEQTLKQFGKLTVIGCPAEEGLCGKADLIRLGAFRDVDVAMMAHPSQFTLSSPKYVSMTPLSIKFDGKAAHASSYPWEGLNALDAAVLCYNNISCLRQQMKPNWRVHGVIKNGGEQPNIIPEQTQLEYYLRTPTDTEMVVLKQKVTGCVQGAAMATGCTVDMKFGEKSYSNLMSNKKLAQTFEKNATSIGVAFEQSEEKRQKFGGSTDMGNVSHVVPSIHPKFYIGTTVPNHSRPFTDAAGKPEAQKYTLDIAKAIAMTAIDVFESEELLQEIKADFQSDIGNG